MTKPGVKRSASEAGLKASASPAAKWREFRVYQVQLESFVLEGILSRRAQQKGTRASLPALVNPC